MECVNKVLNTLRSFHRNTVIIILVHKLIDTFLQTRQVGAALKNLDFEKAANLRGRLYFYNMFEDKIFLYCSLRLLPITARNLNELNNLHSKFQ